MVRVGGPLIRGPTESPITLRMTARLSQFMVETHFLGSCVLTITTGLSASEKVKVCGPQDRSSDLGGQFFSL